MVWVGCFSNLSIKIWSIKINKQEERGKWWGLKYIPRCGRKSCKKLISMEMFYW